MLWLHVTFLALFASVQGRAVNISNTWVLPEEGFPVFYRYFRDRISWYEADAVCQFHHANLVTVDTTAQYDAVRAYLKELDIASAVWVGLIRSNPDGDFTWTDYRGLSGDGYWSAAPDARAAPLCAAADPAADYRWEARACGGPSVASFICELPVPQWALGNDGCMVRALPALTALYLPESAAVQLTADCGLAGVKRVQCTGNVKREELLRDLSCSDENDPSSTSSLTSTSITWRATDTTLTDQEMTTEDTSTEDNIVTESKETSNTGTQITQTFSPDNIDTMSEAITSTKQHLNNDYIRLPLNKDVERIHTNKIISNDIPLQENPLENQNLQTIENDNNYKHRLLHDEMTRLGNLDNIFTQPTDHFVPPLVMAKARISDDMTVLSLKAKHAQQIAEQRLHKHNKFVEHMNITPFQTTTIDSQVISTSSDTPTANKQKLAKQDKTPEQSVQNDSVKKDVKSSVPKKYLDKYNNPKAKIWRTVDYKIQKADKIDVLSTKQSLDTTIKTEDSSKKMPDNIQKDSEEDSIIDLTVIIKEPGTENGQEIFYSNHSNKVPKFESNITVTDKNVKAMDLKYLTTDKPNTQTSFATDESSDATSIVTLNHEIIKITVLDDKTSTETSTPLVFEVSTMVPVFNHNSGETKDTLSFTTTGGYPASPKPTIKNLTEVSTEATSLTTHALASEPVTTPAKEEPATSAPSTAHDINLENKVNIAYSTKLVTKHGITTDATIVSTGIPVNEITTEDVSKLITTTVDLPTKLSEITMTEKSDMLNHTENVDDDQDQQEGEIIDDYQSPLLSAANEPLHRPNRSRRPQQPLNRMKKFNPFRMLG